MDDLGLIEFHRRRLELKEEKGLSVVTLRVRWHREYEWRGISVKCSRSVVSDSWRCCGL